MSEHRGRPGAYIVTYVQRAEDWALHRAEDRIHELEAELVRLRSENEKLARKLEFREVSNSHNVPGERAC